MSYWTTAIPAVMAAFLASVVEIVEAFTVVLAVQLVRGWRPALYGSTVGLLVLVAIVVFLGPVLDRIPIRWLQLLIGVLLLLFGTRWLRKAILRSAGVVPLHDEIAALAAERHQLEEQVRRHEQGLDWVAGVTAFKAVVLEGVEVVFIVIAVGAGRGLLIPASLGAAIAAFVVLAIGFAIHRPLSVVPENTLKTAVGIMLTSFGVFWIGEGLGVEWPGHDLALLVFVIVFFSASRIVVGLATFTAETKRPWLRGVWGDLFGLFVDDRNLALVILGIVALSAVMTRYVHPNFIGGMLLFGTLTALIENVVGRSRRAP